ncbi:MAG: hypothetical protein ACRDRR_11215 [Pseudonocardiaceae bacterium]
MTIQLPSPGRAGVRAVRLATAMTTRGPGDHAVNAALPGGTGDPRPAAREDNPWRDIDGPPAPAGF